MSASTRLTMAAVEEAPVSEAELLARMASRSEQRPGAREAWEELYVRHRRYLYVVVSRTYGSFLGEDGTVDLVCDTFSRAYEWAGRQGDPDQVRTRFSAGTPDETRRLVLGWLGAIANRLFMDRYRDSAFSATEFHLFLDDWRAAREFSKEAERSPALEQLNEALSLLSPGEADSLRVSLPWYDLETRSFSVPRGEATQLAALLGISVDSLRQRRHRAIKRLAEHFDQAGCSTAIQEETS